MMVKKIEQLKSLNWFRSKKGHKKTSLIILLLVSISFMSTSVFASSSSEVSDDSFHEAMNNPSVIKILSIDGGGIRGLIPLYFLERIEKEMGQPIAEIFDMIAGTSTGGIIALGLTTPADPTADSPTPKYRPSDMIEVYSEHGEQIFGKKHKKWFNFGGLTRPRYSSKGITKLSKGLLGDSKLSDSITNVLVTSFETERYKPFFFNSHRAKHKSSQDFYTRDIAVGTSAAPTYFSPKKLKSMSGKEYTVIDGGVVLNNPALSALASAREIYPDAEDFLVVSLGTGQSIKRISYNSMHGAGGIKWVKPLTSIMMQGVASSVDYQMQQFFPDEYVGHGAYKKRYFRFQPTIPQEDKSMDDVSKSHIRSLTLAAEDEIEKRDGEINSLISLLKEIQRIEIKETRSSFSLPKIYIKSHEDDVTTEESIDDDDDDLSDVATHRDFVEDDTSPILSRQHKKRKGSHKKSPLELSVDDLSLRSIQGIREREKSPRPLQIMTPHRKEDGIERKIYAREAFRQSRERRNRTDSIAPVTASGSDLEEELLS
tara:strand:+ start:2066 stop:3688 length:1623 start_codon:yes stop_codon:yes gene_type:complete